MYLQNLHTHSTFCDGRDTPEEMLDRAISLGFNSIGFSGHSYMSYSNAVNVSYESTAAYKKRINELKDEYKGKIDVFLGLEFDMLSDDDPSGLDYSIGSVHYLKTKDGIIGFDRSAEIINSVITDNFDGDRMAFVRSYFEHMAALPAYGNYDIIGHFDLVNKHLGNPVFMGGESPEYFSLAFEAISKLKGKIPLFEINTGCISRGYRAFPYPTPTIVREFKRQGFGVVITSDCHDSRYLDVGFKEARAMVKECGFDYIHVLTDKGFVPERLEV